MNKIAELLAQLGSSKELTKSILSSMEEYKTNLQEQYEASYKRKLLEARQLCVSEFEKEKAELARKVEIFLEARVATIDKIAQKQAAIGEGNALKTLRDAKALLEGVTIEGGNPVDIQAAMTELQALRTSNRQLQENKEKSELKAKRAHDIASKLLERTRILESQVKTPVIKKSQVVESTQKPVVKPKLSSLRNTGTDPRTSRQPISESLAKHATGSAKTDGDPEVMKIANLVDDEPAYIE